MSEVNWGFIIQIVIAGGIVWILKGVSTINGSIREIKQWQTDHEMLDSVKYDQMETLRKTAKQERRDLWAAIKDSKA